MRVSSHSPVYTKTQAKRSENQNKANNSLKTNDVAFKGSPKSAAYYGIESGIAKRVIQKFIQAEEKFFNIIPKKSGKSCNR